MASGLSRTAANGAGYCSATRSRRVRTAAAGSIGEALNAATCLGGPSNTDLAFAAKLSFLYAMQGSLTVLAIVTAGAAVLISMFAPGRDGKALFRR